jgi:thiosulfate dehydrogenase [quinone] large subunit
LQLLREPDGAMLLLRAFLGVTFTVAGLQKLANPNFFRAAAPGSFVAQLRGSIVTSPLHHLLDPALHAPVLVAVLISLGEVAVGLGTLCGLFGRVAAVGGMLLSLSFFLTVSFNDQPYYYGADIVFLFAWTPLAIGGSGQRSLDALYAHRRRTAREGTVAAAARNSSLARRRASEFERRVILQRFAAIGAIGAIGAVLSGVVAGFGRLLAPSSPARATGPQLGGSRTSAAPAANSGTKGTRLGPANGVPVGGAASFTDPAQGIPAFVVQPVRGQFLAFSAVCTHAGCLVQFDSQNDAFVCPCHGSTFSAKTGAVLGGPAPTALASIPITLGPGNDLYVDG